MTQELSEFEQIQTRNARHRALILQILKAHPQGLTVQQIIEKENHYYGYTFLTDNRLRELKKAGFVESFGMKPQYWKLRE